ncbi:MAG: hypothetical protein MHM6MM_009260 [Cercozoa sp. M6MM]
MQEELDDLLQKNETIRKNMSALYETAVREAHADTQLIGELQASVHAQVDDDEVVPEHLVQHVPLWARDPIGG